MSSLRKPEEQKGCKWIVSECLKKVKAAKKDKREREREREILLVCGGVVLLLKYNAAE